ncbi:MAG: hypothetical protein O7D27_03120 [Alphaproteobacteria bacterium]|nr:hypothetical protein [Alphaproteobacteria bacterium]
MPDKNELERAYEEHLNRVYRELRSAFPGREGKIERLIFGEITAPHAPRGVKADTGQPRVNKDVLAAWVKCFERIYACYLGPKKAGTRGLDLTLDMFPPYTESFQKMESLGLSYAIISEGNRKEHPLSKLGTFQRYHAHMRSPGFDKTKFKAEFNWLDLGISAYFQTLPRFHLARAQKYGGEKEQDRFLNRQMSFIDFYGTKPWTKDFEHRSLSNALPRMRLIIPKMKKAVWGQLRDGFMFWDDYRYVTLTGDYESIAPQA